MSAPPAAGRTYKWQCKHCSKEIPDLSHATSISFCPMCGKNVGDMPHEDTVAPNQGRQGFVDAEAAGISEVGLIMDTSTAGLSDPNGGKSSSESSGSELYPKLVDMDISFESCSLSDQSSSTLSDDVLPKKRQLEDGQHVVSEFPKKKCDSEGPSSPTSLPNQTLPPQSSPMPSQFHPSQPLPSKELIPESGRSDHGSTASCSVTDDRNQFPVEHLPTLCEEDVEKDGVEDDDGFTVVQPRKNRNRNNKEADSSGGDQASVHIHHPITLSCCDEMVYIHAYRNTVEEECRVQRAEVLNQM